MKASISRRRFLALSIYATVLSINAVGEDSTGDLKVTIDVLNRETDPGIREKSARKLYDACFDCVRTGKKAVVTASLDQLIHLLDEKESVVVYWTAMAIGLLGSAGKPALPKLEELYARPRPKKGPSKSSLSGVEIAIYRIKND